MNIIFVTLLICLVILLFLRFALPSRNKLTKLTTNYFVPILLIFLWAILVIFQSFEIERVFTILTDSYPASSLNQSPVGEITAGKKIIGSFTASENNLGIIGFRFWTFYRLNGDFVKFRIKEANSPTWYYQAEYKSDQFPPNNYFTFGFPEIKNSLGKVYNFEIESLEGIAGDAVGISDVDPVYIVKYKYPKNLVVSSPKNFVNFIYIKLTNLIRNSYFSSASFVFLLPVMIYVLSISRLGIGWKKWLSISLSVVGLAASCMFIKNDDLSTLVLIIVYIYLFKSFVILTDFYLLIGSLLLTASAIFEYVGRSSFSEPAAAWSWIFITIWLTIQLWKLKKQS